MREIIADTDPSRLVIRLEVQLLASFLNTMVDQLLHGGLSLHHFQPHIDSRIALLRDTGYPELAGAIAEDLDHLAVELRGLRDLQAAGVSSYVTAHEEARVEAWRDARAFAGLEVQMGRDRVHHTRAAVAESSSLLSHSHSSIAASVARIAQLKQELQAEETNLHALELARAKQEESHTVIIERLESSESALVELEKKASQTSSASEESFRAELREELQQAYHEELSVLGQRICRHKLSL